MSLSTQPYKGTRDFYPEDKRFQKWMFSKWRKVAESFGYEEYDAPLIEPLELYAAKTGEEIVNEQTYAFEDRGNRKVAIRPEMTPTVSRMVAARRQELSYPLRLYSIPNLWRYERPQRGRLREHWQLNIDLFGVEGIEAEIEMIEIADTIMRSFGASKEMYTIKLNSRKLMNHLIKHYLNLNDEALHNMSKLIDRMHKIDSDTFNKQLSDIVSAPKLEQGIKLLQSRTLSDLPEDVQSHQSVTELTELIDNLQNQTIDNIEFDITLMRGFDYYNDIVFEIFDNDPENNRSLFGGGRYDGLVALFGVEPVATIGFGVGDVTFQNFLEAHKLTEHLPSTTDVIAILVGQIASQARPVLEQLRKDGVNVAVDYSNRKLEKQLKSAAKSGVRHAIVIGQDELASKTVKLKDLTNSKEQTVDLTDVKSTIDATR